MTVLLTSKESYLLFLFLGLVLLSLFSISRILKIAQKFNWVDTPEARSMHETPVPSFGGIAFFLNIIIMTIFVFKYYHSILEKKKKKFLRYSNHISST